MKFLCRYLILACLFLFFSVNAYSQSEPAPKSGDTYIEPVTGIEFVWVEGGCYQMGQTESEMQYLIDEIGEVKYKKFYIHELPRHKVCVDGFWMAKYEVTNKQFRLFKSRHKSTPKGVNLNKAKQPAVYVSFKSAKKFIKWLNKKTSQKFALPTEAQWEYACRAGTKTICFWGNNEKDACQYANVYDRKAKSKFNFKWKHHSCTDGYAGSAPVGSFQPNNFGLYDMLGNVWEWCEDIYDENAYSKHTTANNPLITSGSEERVVRGGGWGDYYAFIRSASRLRGTPNDTYYDIGFRLCSARIRQ